MDADCGGLTLLNALFDQNRMGKRQEGGDDAVRRFVGVSDFELARLLPLADKRFEDGQDVIIVRVEGCPTSIRGGDKQLVHWSVLHQGSRAVPVNGGQKISQLFARRRIRSCNFQRDFRNLFDNQSADGTVDRRLRGKEAIDIGAAHAEFRGDVSDRRLVIADPPKIPFRHLENPRPRLLEVTCYRVRKIHHPSGEHHSAANAVGSSTSFDEFSWPSFFVGLMRNQLA
ncbi:hypothetical protein RHECNPAF_299007 [Rhizobium etli CNPAF512]|nr:hypothetical protein RHECNPAF_299007 [Rhizobium etli CNPAF512]